MNANKLWATGTIIWLFNALGWCVIGSITHVDGAVWTGLGCAALSMYCLIHVE